MSLIVENDGTIHIYQGDSGVIVINGLDETKSYTIYFAIQNSSRNLIGDELQVSVSNSDTVTFVLTPDFTDLLTVPQNKPYETYFYGIKACENDTTNEDTLFVSNNTYGDLNRVIVYPRQVKGVISGS
ncbi:MAG: hypothetical protein MJ237_07505 [bacterium]|nr:hypothetical protein [bacterium]